MLALTPNACHLPITGEYPNDAVLLAYGRAAYAYQLLEAELARIFDLEIGSKWTLGNLLDQRRDHPLLTSNKTLRKKLFKAMRWRNWMAHRLFLAVGQDWGEVAAYLTEYAAFFDALRLSLSQ